MSIYWPIKHSDPSSRTSAARPGPLEKLGIDWRLLLLGLALPAAEPGKGGGILVGIGIIVAEEAKWVGHVGSSF